MKNHIRIQPYIPRELHSKLGTYCAAANETVSAVVREALVQYMKRDDVDRDLILRRIDGISQPLGKVQHDLDVLARTFATFANFACSFVPAPVSGGKLLASGALPHVRLGRVVRIRTK